jgi:hypothetical protein
LLAYGDELRLVLALRRDRLKVCFMFGFGLGSLELGLLDGLDPRGFFALPLLGYPAAFVRIARPAFLCVPGGSFLGIPPFPNLARLTLLICRLLGNSVLLEIHQFLEGKENGAFLLFCHLRHAS